MPLQVPEFPNLKSVYVELTTRARQGEENIFKFCYESPDPLASELSWNQEDLVENDFRPSDMFFAVRSIGRHNVELRATNVVLTDPYSLAEQRLHSLIADIAADPVLARSPRRIRDRLEAI